MNSLGLEETCVGPKDPGQATRRPSVPSEMRIEREASGRGLPHRRVQLRRHVRMTDDAVRLAHQFGFSESPGLDELIVEVGLPSASVREAISVSSLMEYSTVVTGRFLRIFRLQAACLIAKRNPPADPKQSDSAWRGIDAYKLCSCVNFGCRETTGPGQRAAMPWPGRTAFKPSPGFRSVRRPEPN
jgi:hypothetical protein